MKGHLPAPAFSLLPGEEICSAEETDSIAVACAPVGDFSRWGDGSFFVLLQPSSPAALESSGPPPACAPISHAAQACAHTQLGRATTSAEPVRKQVYLYLSRAFSTCEKRPRGNTRL